MADPVNALEPKNIHIGAGSLYIKGPNDNALVPAGLCRDFSIKVTPKLLEIFADQSIFPFDQIITNAELDCTVELLEFTLRNLVLAYGGDPDDVVDDGVANTLKYTIKANISSPPNLEMFYKVARPKEDDKFIRLTFPQVQSSGGLDLKFVKDKENTFKFAVKALPKLVGEDLVVLEILVDKYSWEIPAPGAAPQDADKSSKTAADSSTAKTETVKADSAKASPAEDKKK